MQSHCICAKDPTFCLQLLRFDGLDHHIKMCDWNTVKLIQGLMFEKVQIQSSTYAV